MTITQSIIFAFFGLLSSLAIYYLFGYVMDTVAGSDFFLGRDRLRLFCWNAMNNSRIMIAIVIAIICTFAFSFAIMEIVLDIFN